MKAYTDIEQSKKLAEILPVESADMFYRNNGIDVKLMWEHNAHNVKYPCWSLAALIDLLPNGTVLSKSDYGSYFIGGLLYDNLLDACVNMIFTLKGREDLI